MFINIYLPLWFTWPRLVVTAGNIEYKHNSRNDYNICGNPRLPLVLSPNCPVACTSLTTTSVFLRRSTLSRDERMSRSQFDFLFCHSCLLAHSARLLIFVHTCHLSGEMWDGLKTQQTDDIWLDKHDKNRWRSLGEICCQDCILVL